MKEIQDKLNKRIIDASNKYNNKVLQFTVTVTNDGTVLGIDEIAHYIFNGNSKIFVTLEDYQACETKLESANAEIEKLKNYTINGYEIMYDELKSKIKTYKYAIDYWNNEENWVYGEPNKDGSRNTYSIRYMVNQMKELTKELL